MRVCRNTKFRYTLIFIKDRDKFFAHELRPHSPTPVSPQHLGLPFSLLFAFAHQALQVRFPFKIPL